MHLKWHVTINYEFVKNYSLSDNCAKTIQIGKLLCCVISDNKSNSSPAKSVTTITKSLQANTACKVTKTLEFLAYQGCCDDQAAYAVSLAQYVA